MRKEIAEFLDRLADRLYLLREQRSQTRAKHIAEAEQAAEAPPVKKPEFDWSQMRKGKFWRAWFNRNAPIILAAVMVLLLISVGTMAYFYSGFAPKPAPNQVWYYDTSTGKPFRTKVGQTPPIDAPSGARDLDGNGTGVRAYMMTCGSCANESELFVGYVESFTAAAKKARDEAQAKAKRPIDSLSPAARRELGIKPGATSGRKIAKPAMKPEWLLADTEADAEAVAALLDEVMKRCGEGKTPTDCF